MKVNEIRGKIIQILTEYIAIHFEISQYIMIQKLHLNVEEYTGGLI